MKTIKIISVRENPEYKQIAIQYFQEKWASKESMMVYEDCISACINAKTPLPQWYLLYQEDEIIGCTGMITNDFISRMDLYPWACGVYIEEKARGNAYASLLLEKAKQDAARFGYSQIYLCTDHVGFYEHYGFHYIADGYHPWGETSRIYEADTRINE